MGDIYVRSGHLIMISTRSTSDVEYLPEVYHSKQIYEYIFNKLARGHVSHLIMLNMKHDT